MYAIVSLTVFADAILGYIKLSQIELLLSITTAVSIVAAENLLSIDVKMFGIIISLRWIKWKNHLHGEKELM